MTSASNSAAGRGGAFYWILAFLVVVLALAFHGIHDTSHFNGAFPIVLDAVQSIGSAFAAKDTSFEYGPDGLPFCNKCHCTPSLNQDPSKFTCPTTAPKWNYSLETIESLASHVVQNPFVLNCNPYEDVNCDTVPSLTTPQNKNNAVCGLNYDKPRGGRSSSRNEKNCQLLNYTMQTYASEMEARSAGAVVTHLGPCGACSTTQDLAAYMRHPDMVAEGRRCTNRALLSKKWGVQCYQRLGFTLACATIWAHNSINSATHCRSTCVQYLFAPANQAEPMCELNACLQCDEEKSGPLFQIYAGRTRRNSGLRTPILRSCEGLATLEHEACPPMEDTVMQ